MEISVKQFENVLNTLPISYYLGEGTEVEINTTSEDTYMDPMTNKVTISFPMMANLLKRTKEVGLEEGIRCALYHEISHAILTPRGLKGYELKEIENDAVNVMEDERIEWHLRDFYHGVNFKKFIVELNNHHKGDKPQDAFGYFYSIVRFREGPDNFVNRVQEIIDKYPKIKHADEDYLSHQARDYRRELLEFFYEVCKDYLEQNAKDKLDEQANKGSGSSYDQLPDYKKTEVVKQVMEDQSESTEKYPGGKVTITAEDIKEGRVKFGKGQGQGQGQQQGEGQGVEIELTPEAAELIAKEIMERAEKSSKGGKIGGRGESIKDFVINALNPYIDAKLTDDLGYIFEKFKARFTNEAAALNRYSGIFNPRAVGREDWRCWEYKCDEGNIKGFDKLHLNLYIDSSGSYDNNEARTNVLLQSLKSLERTYPYFSFDLVELDDHTTLQDKDHRYHQTGGGTYLRKCIHQIFSKLQDPQSYNYNIVLYDGGMDSEDHPNFSAFNNDKTSIISDTDNEEPIKRYAPLANRIIVRNTSSKSYAELLTDNVMAALNKALLF